MMIRKALLSGAAAILLGGAANPAGRETAQDQTGELAAKVFSEMGGHSHELSEIQVERGHAAAEYCAETTIKVHGGFAEAMACAAGFLRGVNWAYEAQDRLEMK